MAVYNIGSSGQGVRELQELLKGAGYDPGTIDGQYGTNTANAVKQFQRANNLTIDGIAGSQTLGSLTKPIPQLLPNTTPNVGPTNLPNVSPVQNPISYSQQTNLPDVSGLTGFRDYGVGKGLDIGWSKETGPTVDGKPVDISGLVNRDDKNYGTLEQLNSIFDPFTKPSPGNTVAPPVYESRYDDKFMAILDRYLEPEPFKYDYTTDPSYQAYENKYKSLGDTAFQNTIGDIASISGDGRLSSWSTSAASQARNKYMQDLSNVIPMLEQQAYGRNRDAYGDIGRQLEALQALDSKDYGKYRDSVGDFQTNRGFDRGVLESDRSFDRGILESDRNFDYQVNRDNILDDRWMEQFDYEKQQNIIKNAIQNRQISISEGNAALSRAEFNYRKEEAAKAKDSVGYTQEQVGAYNNLLSAYTREGRDPIDAYNYLTSPQGRKNALDYGLNEGLYNQMVADLQSRIPEVEQKPARGIVLADIKKQLSYIAEDISNTKKRVEPMIDVIFNNVDAFESNQQIEDLLSFWGLPKGSEAIEIYNRRK